MPQRMGQAAHVDGAIVEGEGALAVRLIMLPAALVNAPSREPRTPVATALVALPFALVLLACRVRRASLAMLLAVEPFALVHVPTRRLEPPIAVVHGAPSERLEIMVRERARRGLVAAASDALPMGGRGGHEASIRRGLCLCRGRGHRAVMRRVRAPRLQLRGLLGDLARRQPPAVIDAAVDALEAAGAVWRAPVPAAEVPVTVTEEVSAEAFGEAAGPLALVTATRREGHRTLALRPTALPAARVRVAVAEGV